MIINQQEKILLLLLKDDISLMYDQVKNEMSRDNFDTSARSLNAKNFVDTIFNEQKQCVKVTLKQNGKAYLQENHKARNPFFTENRKWVIGLLIPLILFILGYILKSVLI